MPRPCVLHLIYSKVKSDVDLGDPHLDDLDVDEVTESAEHIRQHFFRDLSWSSHEEQLGTAVGRARDGLVARQGHIRVGTAWERSTLAGRIGEWGLHIWLLRAI